MLRCSLLSVCADRLFVYEIECRLRCLTVSLVLGHIAALLWQGYIVSVAIQIGRFTQTVELR